MPRCLIAGFLWIWLTPLASAEEWLSFPSRLELQADSPAQKLTVYQQDNGIVVGHLYDGLNWSSENEAVATVDQAGKVTPVSAGQTEVTVSADGKKVRITIIVNAAGDELAPGFRNQIIPILTKTGCNSGACHGALAGKGGFKLSLRGYDPVADHFAISQQALGRRVDFDNPADSLVLSKATRTIRHGGGTRFDEDSEHYQTIESWIRHRAPDQPDREPALVELEIFPKQARIKLEQAVPIRVRAKYADGSQQDVTELSLFASSLEPVATVDEDGVVTAAGPGETGIAAIFSGKVAVSTFAVPYESDKPIEKTLTKFNKVDDFVNDKLVSLNIPASGLTTDAEFARRAYLDIAGTLPKAEELDRFLKDGRPDKRQRLVNELLARPEYVDFWTHKWADTLLVSTRKLQQPAMWAMHRGIRQAVAENRPWDRFARDILTAKGSTMTAGGGNYFVMHKDVAELAEATATTFMGMAIGCAKCHNHPMEKWTQDQYWSFANLFHEVSLKDGSANFESIVVDTTEGDLLHPRTGEPLTAIPLDGPKYQQNSAKNRREFFADWLTDPKNPFFAKSITNRVWADLMGRGLIDPVDDMRDTNPASHPELLDYLTQEFVDNNFDIQHLIRLITSSAAYQRTSQPIAGNEKDDRFYSHWNARRLPAEVILDAYADLTGVPTNFNQISRGPSGGLINSNAYPLGTRAVQLPDSLVISRFLDSFGRAERREPCSCERSDEPSVQQALHLNNGVTLNEKLRDKNSRTRRWLKPDAQPETVVRELFWQALARQPDDSELSTFVTVIREAKTEQEKQEAIEDIVWAVLTSKEFLFNH